MILGYGFELWFWALVLRDQPSGRRRTLYHGLGTAPAAETLPGAAGSDFFFLAAGSAAFFFAGCSDVWADVWPSRVVRSRDAFRSSFSFLRSVSLSSTSARGAGRSCTAGNSGGVSERGGIFSGKPPTTA